MGSDAVSKQIVSELNEIVGHPAGGGELLGDVEKKKPHMSELVSES